MVRLQITRLSSTGRQWKKSNAVSCLIGWPSSSPCRLEWCVTRQALWEIESSRRDGRQMYLNPSSLRKDTSSRQGEFLLCGCHVLRFSLGGRKPIWDSPVFSIFAPFSSGLQLDRDPQLWTRVWFSALAILMAEPPSTANLVPLGATPGLTGLRGLDGRGGGCE